ncbi:uncharacterized protein METZ01_LOCUS502633, partial [marine metagenome]
MAVAEKRVSALGVNLDTIGHEAREILEAG